MSRRSTDRKSHERFVDRALEMGAVDAKLISPKDVVTAGWVRLKCQYGCSGYGKRHTCPPYSPTAETTRKVLDSYSLALLFHAKDSQTIRAIGPALEREIFLSGYYKAFAFLCGPCRLCSPCDPTKLCRHPYEARPAMEACGIDVFATVRKAGMPIEVVTDHSCEQNYYGLVLIE